jgi:hypothetical protein
VLLPIDPAADLGRKAWVPCPRCEDHLGCATCEAGRNCPDHWRYLLSNKGSLVHLQCPGCTHLWSWETGFGSRHRPSGPAH